MAKGKSKANTLEHAISRIVGWSGGVAGGLNLLIAECPSLRGVLLKVPREGMKEEVDFRLLKTTIDWLRTAHVPEKAKAWMPGNVDVFSELLDIAAERLAQRRASKDLAKVTGNTPGDEFAREPSLSKQHLPVEDADRQAKPLQGKASNRGRPRVSDAEKLVPVTIHIDADLKASIDELARREGRTFAGLCRQVLSGYVEHSGF